MGQRLSLHNILVGILGTQNVYFQPPPSVQLSYPCILYSPAPVTTTFAGNEVYNIVRRWTITFITKEADSQTVFDIIRGLRAKHDRSFSTDGLYHNVFTISY